MRLESYKWNVGAWGGTYDNATGVYTGLQGGIWEYRAGDVVRHARGKTADMTVRCIHVNGGPLGDLASLEFTNGNMACISMYVPTNPERMTYGFVVTGFNPAFPGKPCGFTSRYESREKAERDVARILEKNPHAQVQILEREPD